MIKNVSTKQKALTFLLRTIFTIAIFFIAVSAASAQTPTCGVGTKVAFEWSPDTVGTIMEIGTESPHVGWFGIKFDWSKNLEWSAPQSNGLLIAGTKTPCVRERASSKQTPKTADNSSSSTSARNAARAAQNNETVLPEISGCPFNAPPGKVTRTSPASAALFKRVIYERAAAKINPESITAPKRVGITFAKFEMGAAYKNTWSSTRFGDKRLHTGAPLNTTIYPLKTVEVLCELHGDKVRRTVTEETHDCFKNNDGDWVCPGRITKYVESKLIPVN